MARRNRRQKARARVAKRLAKGKNVKAAKIAKHTGVSRKRAKIIIAKKKAKAAAPAPAPRAGGAKKYFKQNDPGKKISKREVKAAVKSGVSAKAIKRYIKH